MGNPTTLAVKKVGETFEVSFAGFEGLLAWKGNDNYVDFWSPMVHRTLSGWQ